jgi:hypothetical protein
LPDRLLEREKEKITHPKSSDDGIDVKQGCGLFFSLSRRAYWFIERKHVHGQERTKRRKPTDAETIGIFLAFMKRVDA